MVLLLELANNVLRDCIIVIFLRRNHDRYFCYHFLFLQLGLLRLLDRRLNRCCFGLSCAVVAEYDLILQRLVIHLAF